MNRPMPELDLTVRPLREQDLIEISVVGRPVHFTPGEADRLIGDVLDALEALETANERELKRSAEADVALDAHLGEAFADEPAGDER